MPERAAGKLYGDVRVGTTTKRIGIPRDQVPWGWFLRASIPVVTPENSRLAAISEILLSEVCRVGNR
jgi:hypothetical protein